MHLRANAITFVCNISFRFRKFRLLRPGRTLPLLPVKKQTIQFPTNIVQTDHFGPNNLIPPLSDGIHLQFASSQRETKRSHNFRLRIESPVIVSHGNEVEEQSSGPIGEFVETFASTAIFMERPAWHFQGTILLCLSGSLLARYSFPRTSFPMTAQARHVSSSLPTFLRAATNRRRQPASIACQCGTFQAP